MVAGVIILRSNIKPKNECLRAELHSIHTLLWDRQDPVHSCDRKLACLGPSPQRRPSSNHFAACAFCACRTFMRPGTSGEDIRTFCERCCSRGPGVSVQHMWKWRAKIYGSSDEGKAPLRIFRNFTNSRHLGSRLRKMENERSVSNKTVKKEGKISTEMIRQDLCVELAKRFHLPWRDNLTSKKGNWMNAGCRYCTRAENQLVHDLEFPIHMDKTTSGSNKSHGITSDFRAPNPQAL